MDIRTSTMIVGIRGTFGWVEDETLMCVYLLRGKVECSILDGENAVQAAEMPGGAKTNTPSVDTP